ncbi:peptidylprolyl isomerase [Pseudodesulfovibrio cashew]|uniref:Periplasmic chaperone PpiD n=1 Tax=Pseudodesulfovibrio cashew TaxID=2678688 RepID=A0A6I6JHR6_9BACT|nr:SurA N-terminal domain-containing protein [Pseudodesulfovibrio cashew]QGY39892.1 peptidylprolyl isomerase [Pseudodesulfovibrio cashew]
MLEAMRENASGWIIKILFAVIIVVFVFAFGMSGLDTGNDPVMATVNDQVITRAEFEDAFQRAAEGLRKSNPNVTSAQLQSPQFKQMILGELINSRLLLGEAAKLGISASDEEVFAAITRLSVFWNQQGQFDRNLYQQALRGVRMTPAQFEANFKNEYISGKVQDMIRATSQVTPAQARQIYDWVNEKITIDYILSSPAQFLAQTEVTEDEVKKFYNENEDKFMVPEQVQVRYLTFTPKDLATYQKVSDEEIADYFAAHKDSMVQQEQVKARHILIMVKDSDTETEQKDAKAKIDNIYALAKSGKDFAALAKKYSEGPSAPNGGELGWFARGAMVPEFEEAAFATPKGGISEPVKTQFGWHIIQVEDKKEAQVKTLDEVKEDIRQILAEEKASEKVTDLLDQAMDRMVSGMKLDAIGDELGMLAVTSRPMPEKFLPQAFGMTPEAAKVIMAIPEGEAHQTPIAVDGGYMLVEKAKDIPAAPMPLEQVEVLITNNLKQEKATVLAQKAAEDILAKLKAGETDGLEARIKASDPFARNGNVPDLGQSPDLANAAFGAKDNNWLAEPFVTPAGIVVARLGKRIPASNAVWEQQKQAWIAQASRNYENETLNGFMTGLREKASIEITRPDLLN